MPDPIIDEPLFEELLKDLVDRQKDVDPYNELHMGSLATGWAIAKGLQPDKAREFATKALELALGV